MPLRVVFALVVAVPTAAAQTEAADDGEVIEITPEPEREPATPPAAEIERDDIQRVAGGRGDALESLRNQAGVSFADDGQVAGGLVIRGTSGTDSSYLIDGVPIPQSAHFGSLTTIIGADMLESVELRPGGFDASVGRATGGVVELKTRRPDLHDWSAVADLSYVHAGVFFAGPLLDNLTIAAGLRRSFIDAVLPLVVDDDEISFTGAPRYEDAQLRLDYYPSWRDEVTVLGLFSDDSIAATFNAEVATDPILAGGLVSRERFWRLIARWSHQRGPLRSRATVSAGRSIEGFGIGEQFGFDVDSDELYLREDLSLELGDRLRLRGGGDLEAARSDLSGRLTAIPVEGAAPVIVTTAEIGEIDERITTVNTAGYLAADIRPHERVTITPGFRADRYGHINDLVLQPRLAVSVDVGGGFEPFAALGRYSRPHGGPESRPDHLEAETAIQAVAGVSVALPIGARVKLTGFASWLDDLVVFDPAVMEPGGDPFDAYTSTGDGTAHGVEVSASLRRDRLLAYLVYTLSRSRRVDGPGQSERRFDYDQPHNLVAAASWQVGAWSLGGRFRFASGTPDTPVVGSDYLADFDLYQPRYGALNSERLPAAHQLDLRIDRRFDFDRWRLAIYLDVSNVYGHGRVVGYSYSFDYSERTESADLPLLPSIGVRGEL